MERIERVGRLYPLLFGKMGRLRTLVHEGMDLTYNQYKTLLTIADRGECSLGDLGRELEIAMSSASQMVDRLVGQGLVHRRAGRGEPPPGDHSAHPAGGGAHCGAATGHSRAVTRRSSTGSPSGTRRSWSSPSRRLPGSWKKIEHRRRDMTRIVVIGAGISGLSTAYALQQGAGEAGREVEIVVLEKEDAARREDPAASRRRAFCANGAPTGFSTTSR